MRGNPILKPCFLVLIGIITSEGVLRVFTREELQIILLDMQSYINRTTILAESPSHKALREKIESMIDNYIDCNHDGWAKCRFCGENFRGVD